MKIYRFSEILNFESEVHATSKAIEDLELILNRFPYESFNNIGVSYLDVEHKSKLQKACYYFNPKRLSLLLRLIMAKNNTVIFHYPFAKGRIFEKILNQRFINRNKVILLVHDIDSLRSNNNQDINKEVQLLNKANGLMLHNLNMEQKLKDNGLTVQNIVNIHIFDYLVKDELLKKDNLRKFSRRVVYAGNLKKSEFINQLGSLKNHQLMFDIYGPFFNENLKELPYINYHGNLDAEDIVFNLAGSFGLVWDGSSITSCKGRYGEYLRYNNPFKASMYIAAQIPLIVWRQSAIAEFVLKHNIGIAVDSLEEIEKILDTMTELQYDRMYKNIVNLSYKVRSGYFTYNAIKKLMDSN